MVFFIYLYNVASAHVQLANQLTSFYFVLAVRCMCVCELRPTVQMYTVTLKWINLQQLQVIPSEDQLMQIQDIIVLYEF